MSELYKLGYMEGLTGIVIYNEYYLRFLLSKEYVKGFRLGYLIRSDFYKPDLYN
jgi:hypothetical protein